jgi:hypothetical protein
MDVSTQLEPGAPGDEEVDDRELRPVGAEREDGVGRIEREDDLEPLGLEEELGELGRIRVALRTPGGYLNTISPLSGESLDLHDRGGVTSSLTKRSSQRRGTGRSWSCFRSNRAGPSAWPVSWT